MTPNPKRSLIQTHLPLSQPPRPQWLTRLHARAHVRPLAWLDLHLVTLIIVLIVFALLLWALSHSRLRS